MKPNTKFNLLSGLVCGFALSNYFSLTIGLLSYNSIWYYSPIITISLTIFFAIWFVRFSDKLKIAEEGY